MSAQAAREPHDEPGGMRVGVVLRSFPELSETFLIHHIAALLDDGHRVTIFAGRSTAQQMHDAVGRYGMLRRTQYLADQDRGLRQVLGVPRALVSALGTPGTLSCLNVARYGTGVLRFRALTALRDFSKQSFDLLHCHYASVGWAYLPFRDVFRVPFVTSFHGDHYASFGRTGRGHLRKLFEQGDAFIANSRFTAGELRSLGCSEEKIHVIPAVVADDGVVFRPRAGGALGRGGQLRILCVARLRVSKGIAVALNAVRLLRDAGHEATLTLVGDGPDHEFFAAECARLDIRSAVRFTGWLTQRDVFAEYRAADVAVLPSIGDACGSNEAQGVVLQEAMLHGVPVIASAIGGVLESLDGGAAGLAFAPGNARALADRIVETAADAPATLARVRHAERFVRRKYLKPAVAKGHALAYEAALRRYAAERGHSTFH